MSEENKIVVPEYAGINYPGRNNMSEILAEVERQRNARRDIVVSTKKMTLVRSEKFGIAMEVEVGKSKETFPMTKRVWGQLATYIGLPMRTGLWHRLRTGAPSTRRKRGQKVQVDKYWDLWIQLFNDILHSESDKRLVRALQKDHPDGKGDWYIRSLLSDAYLIIHNDDIFFAAAEQFQKVGAELWHARLSEDSFMFYAVAPGISAQISEDRAFSDGKGGTVKWKGEAGDVVNAALTISHSETGQGGLTVSPSIMRKATSNYMVFGDVLSKRHLGARHDVDTLLSDETIRKENAILFDKVRDYCVNSFDEERFLSLVSKIEEAAQDEVTDPVAAADALRVVYDMSEERRDRIRQLLVSGRDYSRYGLANAVAQEAFKDDEINADEAIALEQLSAELITTTTVDQLMKTYERKKPDKEPKRRKKKAKADEVQAAEVPAGSSDFDV